jgi:hypothetical protein
VQFPHQAIQHRRLVPYRVTICSGCLECRAQLPGMGGEPIAIDLQLTKPILGFGPLRFQRSIVG